MSERFSAGTADAIEAAKTRLEQAKQWRIDVEALMLSATKSWSLAVEDEARNAARLRDLEAAGVDAL